MSYVGTIIAALWSVIKIPMLLFLSFIAGKEKEKADNNEKILEDIAITSSPVSDADRDKLRNKYRR